MRCLWPAFARAFGADGGAYDEQDARHCPIARPRRRRRRSPSRGSPDPPRRTTAGHLKGRAVGTSATTASRHPRKARNQLSRLGVLPDARPMESGRALVLEAGTVRRRLGVSDALVGEDGDAVTDGLGVDGGAWASCRWSGRRGARRLRARPGRPSAAARRRGRARSASGRAGGCRGRRFPRSASA